jgi:putative PIN family toxin of toxin-antitoxin system
MTMQRGAAGKPLRVVFDTNLIVSALVFRTGTTSRMRQLWQSGGCLPLVSKPTVEELVCVLAYPKFKLYADEHEELLADYLPYAEVVRVPLPAPAQVVPLCRDPFDLPFLQLAAAGAADALVTGEPYLLALAKRTAFAILTPDALVQRLADIAKYQPLGGQ